MNTLRYRNQKQLAILTATITVPEKLEEMKPTARAMEWGKTTITSMKIPLQILKMKSLWSIMNSMDSKGNQSVRH